MLYLAAFTVPLHDACLIGGYPECAFRILKGTCHVIVEQQLWRIFLVIDLYILEIQVADDHAMLFCAHHELMA